MSLFDRIKKTTERYASPMGFKKEPKKELTMREMQKLMREQQVKKNIPTNSSKLLSEQRKHHSYLGEEDGVVDANTNTSTDKNVSPAEQKEYERNMLDYFDDNNVTIKFEPILISNDSNDEINEVNGNTSITSDGIFWAGTIDGQLKFAYMVTPDESTSGVKIERAPTFDANNKENQEIEKKIVNYYDNFYEYWSKNQLEK
jgi:hypothetical protein